MTRETWTGGTYSHAWGTGAITGVAGGLMGIEQTAPAFANFTVKPRIGSLDRAVIRVPTLRGPIAVEANKTHTSVAVPCGAVARLCLAHGLDASDSDAIGDKLLLLDGMVIEGPRRSLDVAGRHLCADGVGCGARGTTRTLSVA